MLMSVMPLPVGGINVETDVLGIVKPIVSVSKAGDSSCPAYLQLHDKFMVL